MVNLAANSGFDGQSVFEDIGTGLLANCLVPLEPLDVTSADKEKSATLTLEKRADIIWRVAQNFALESVAGACEVPVSTVHEVIDDLVQTMIQIRMVRYSASATVRKQCQVINAHTLWARAARQTKTELIARTLESHISSGNWSKLHLLWQDWSLCRNGEDLAFTNPRPAARLVEFLLSAGVAKQSLVVVSAKDATPLATELTGLKIASRQVKPRKGRSMHRLFFAERGIQALSASGATISVIGFHWWMLLIGSILVARGES
jgi:hypothetical protein